MQRFRFGRFELCQTERRLRIDGEPAALGARAFDLLLALIERRDRVVTKHELLDLVWPGVVVEEANVQVQVSALRKLLGPHALATIPGRGYRFTVALDAEGAAAFDAGRERRRAPRGPASNLPVPGEALIGRAADLAALDALLARYALVTVLGAGGIGKTRLGQAAAWSRIGQYAQGVWWIDLAALSTIDKIAGAIANAAGLELGDGDATASLLRALAPRQTLLLLDNCEHLARPLAVLVEAMLRAASRLTVLATSQEALHCGGEHLLRLEPLEVPPVDAPLAAARGYGALQLLEQRARQADRRFALDEETLVPAVLLCRHLDGLPLAIEMVAARLPLLGAEAMQARLGERLRLLRTATHGVPARQQTLRATLDWSHALLASDEQALLHRLSAFVGSFALGRVQQVAAGLGDDAWAALDLLTALIDKSLVQVERVEPPRYRLLETLRLYCAERLREQGQVETAALRHGQAMAALAQEAEREFWDLGDAAWLGRYAADYDDLQAAFERACARRDGEIAADTGQALLRLDHLRNVNPAVRSRAEAAHALLATAGARARAGLWTCIASHGLLAVAAVARLEAARQAVAAWRALDDPQALYLALGFYACECSRQGDGTAADEALAEAAALEQPHWPLRRRMRGAAHVAGTAIHRGDAASYRGASRAELALAEQAGADRAAAWARLKLADAALMAGDVDEAIALGQSAVEELQALDQPSNLGLALCNLCAALLLADRLEPAREAASRALPLVWRNHWGFLVLDPVALIAARSGACDQAARLLGFADAWYAANHDPRQPNEARLAALAGAVIDAALGPAAHARLRAEGTRLSADRAEALAAVAAQPNSVSAA